MLPIYKFVLPFRTFGPFTDSYALFRWWQIPYYYSGCKMYDILAGSKNMESSYVLGKGKALEAFPMLKAAGLCGAVVYYDGISAHRYHKRGLLILLF